MVAGVLRQTGQGDVRSGKGGKGLQGALELHPRLPGPAEGAQGVAVDEGVDRHLPRLPLARGVLLVVGEKLLRFRPPLPHLLGPRGELLDGRFQLGVGDPPLSKGGRGQSAEKRQEAERAHGEAALVHRITP